MNVSDQYIKNHISRSEYAPEPCSPPDSDCVAYANRTGWIDYRINKHMIFSHRNNYYTKESFTEGLHTHDYCELLIYISGNVEYINENTVVTPKPCTAIWFLPGHTHTARLLSASQYERYVIYFSREALENDGFPSAITDFMERTFRSAVFVNEQLTGSLIAALKKSEESAEAGKSFSAFLACAYIAEAIGIICDSAAMSNSSSDESECRNENALTGEMAEIKEYIDKNYASIDSASDIAANFYYSREHLSRKFKSRFNISLADYITMRRINESVRLLGHMSVAEASYSVGFRSQSSYIAAFRRMFGCLPSEYKKTRFG